MRAVVTIGCLILVNSILNAQPLRELLEKAKANYPLLKAKRLESTASEQQVRYAKSQMLPSVDAGYQLNYATYNNITGMATPQYFVPISGPPSSTNSSQAVIGTAAGLLLNWDIFAFGQQTSRVNTAKASSDYQKADEENEVFQHQVRTANAYLDLLIASELVKVYHRNLLRSEENVRIVRSLSRSGLRPGVDTALFKAELVHATVDLLNYQRLRQAQQLQLAELLGEPDNFIVSTDSIFLSKLPAVVDDVAPTVHPVISLVASRLRIAETEKTALQRSLYPKLSLWGTTYGRGSGIRYDGFINSEDGFTLNRYNYGVGLVLSVPLLQFTRTQYEIRSHTSIIEAGKERLNATTLQINSQKRLAEITLNNAFEIANQSPAFFEASDYAYKGILSRYNAGLVSHTEMIQAQYALVQSEAELRKAYGEVWKALLFKAAVNGNLELFVNQL